jgi:hypothetical protein
VPQCRRSGRVGINPRTSRSLSNPTTLLGSRLNVSAGACRTAGSPLRLVRKTACDLEGPHRDGGHPVLIGTPVKRSAIMSDFGLTNLQETFLGHPTRSATSDASVAGRSGGAGAAAPNLPPSWPEGSTGVPATEPARRSRVQRWVANRRGGRVAAAVLMCAAIGVARPPVLLRRSVDHGKRWPILGYRHSGRVLSPRVAFGPGRLDRARCQLGR